MTMRLSPSSLAGTARTLVAVGTVSEAFMFLTTAAAAPRSGDDFGPAASDGAFAGAGGLAAGAAGATGAAGFAGAGAASLTGAACSCSGDGAAYPPGWDAEPTLP